MFFIISFVLICSGIIFSAGYLCAKDKDNHNSWVPMVLFSLILIFLTVFVVAPRDLSFGVASIYEIGLGEYKVEFASESGKTVHVGVVVVKGDNETTVLLHSLPLEAFEDLDLKGSKLRVYEEKVAISGYPNETKVTVRRLSLQ